MQGFGGRRLRIVHDSRYKYLTDVLASFNEARLTPLDLDRQVLIRHELHLEPRGVVLAYRDPGTGGGPALDDGHTHGLAAGSSAWRVPASSLRTSSWPRS